MQLESNGSTAAAKLTDDGNRDHQVSAPRWTAAQKRVVAASYLGWTLDAFDFFLLVFVIKDVAETFRTSITAVASAITLTLAVRPLGALFFGQLADRYGRRPILMLDVGLFALFGFLTAFSPDLAIFLVLRGLFGVAMGGEWGVGASLAMETIPTASRGLVSGLLQSGYPSGYLLASVVFGLLYSHIGWRGMFMISLAPALLILYIRRGVSESPAFGRERAAHVPMRSVLARHWKLALYTTLLMTAFNFLSHGTQDLYPTFLQTQRHLNHATVSTIAVIYNIGAILGGLTLGSASQVFGRRSAVIAAASLVVPAVWLWAYSARAPGLAIGAFLIQFAVQGAWSVVPAHLNELSPPEARATFPGTVYQLGNFIASSNAVIQTWLASRHGGDYALALAIMAIVSAVALSALVLIGREARTADLGARSRSL